MQIRGIGIRALAKILNSCEMRCRRWLDFTIMEIPRKEKSLGFTFQNVRVIITSYRKCVDL